MRSPAPVGGSTPGIYYRSKRGLSAVYARPQWANAETLVPYAGWAGWSVHLAANYNNFTLGLSDQHCEGGRVLKTRYFEQNSGTPSVPSVHLVLMFPILL